MRALPFIALSLVYLVVRTIVLKGLGHALSQLPLSTIVLTCPAVLWFYIRQLIWPARLNAFQDLEYVTSPGFMNFVLPAAAVAVVAFGLWMFARKSEAAQASRVVSRMPVAGAADSSCTQHLGFRRRRSRS